MYPLQKKKKNAPKLTVFAVTQSTVKLKRQSLNHPDSSQLFGHLITRLRLIKQWFIDLTSVVAV